MKFNVYDAIDFYDWEKLDRLQERRAKKFLKLWIKAKDGNQKAKKDLKKHEAEDRELKQRASETGYYWI